MSKILVILLLLLVISLPPRAFGQQQVLQDCNNSNAITIPDGASGPAPIETDAEVTKGATFNVIVNGQYSDFDSWKMQFECGIRNKVETATQVNNTTNTISLHIDNTSKGCEFSAGNHTIKVIGVSKGTDVPQCNAHYFVINSATQCNLSLYNNGVKLSPPTGPNDTINRVITNQSNLTVDGNHLASGGRFNLFMDNHGVLDNSGLVATNFLQTPPFSGIRLDQGWLTPNSHTLSIREYQDLSPYQLLTLFPQAVPLIGPNDERRYGSPLCSLTFIAGTTSNPGYVVQSSNGSSSSKKDFGPPVASGGKQCGSDDNPAIATAIGCIHTNPAELTKDLMTWVIGIGGGLAFLMLLLGAFQMLTSSGNPETLNAGRDRMTSAVIGLLFIIFAVLLLQIIGVGILNLPGFK